MMQLHVDPQITDLFLLPIIMLVLIKHSEMAYQFVQKFIGFRFFNHLLKSTIQFINNPTFITCSGQPVSTEGSEPPLAARCIAPAAC